MMYRTLEVNKVAVSYEITSNIVVGRRYRIAPSQGYAGVIDGVVEVAGIISADCLDDSTQEIVEMIEGYKDAELGMLTDRNDVPLEPDYSEHVQYLDNTIWIVYRYPYGEGINEGLLIFPIEQFLEHTSLF